MARGTPRRGGVKFESRRTRRRLSGPRRRGRSPRATWLEKAAAQSPFGTTCSAGALVGDGSATGVGVAASGEGIGGCMVTCGKGVNAGDGDACATGPVLGCDWGEAVLFPCAVGAVLSPSVEGLCAGPGSAMFLGDCEMIPGTAAITAPGTVAAIAKDRKAGTKSETFIQETPPRSDAFRTWLNEFVQTYLLAV